MTGSDGSDFFYQLASLYREKICLVGVVQSDFGALGDGYCRPHQQFAAFGEHVLCIGHARVIQQVSD